MAIYVPSRRASRTTKKTYTYIYTRLLFCFERLIACINYTIQRYTRKKMRALCGTHWSAAATLTPYKPYN